ncbi:uncharacterized protein LOC117649395 isoform X3 [Thrips palmi]|uniref:Uncharacterized protein LOC117649395 isoform X3 n=1 Tax=Thrips palmi TaxID=161013 RepID=A0A6P8ZS08_THRPL|nr:uncharacterized protein LOC117649395 isoform X3 [Thrips palmi]
MQWWHLVTVVSPRPSTMPTDHYLSWALDTEADDVHEVFLSGIHPSLVDDDLALCVKLERVAATVQDAPRGTRESPEKVRLGVCSDDDGDDEEFLDAVRGQCLADGVLFRHDASLWADGGDEAPADAEATPTPLQTAGCGAPLSEVRLPELERLSMDVVDESDENGIGIDAGCLGICEEPSEMRESGSDVSEMCQGRGLEPMDCVPGGSSSPGCYLAPEAVEEVVVSLTTPLETSPGSEGCTSVLDQASEDHLALVDNGRGDAPREEVCRRDSFSAESPAGEISSGESSHKNVVTHELCQEDPSQEDLLQEDSLLEGPSLQGPAPADLSQVDSSQKGLCQKTLHMRTLL